MEFSLCNEKKLTEKQVSQGDDLRKVKRLLKDHASGKIPIEDVVYEIKNNDALEFAFYSLCISRLFAGSFTKAITTLFVPFIQK